MTLWGRIVWPANRKLYLLALCHSKDQDMRQVLSNRPSQNDTTLNFFYWFAKSSSTASLACPFFTNTKPLEILLEAGASKIQLIIRLCEATSAKAVQQARKMDNVTIRYFTDPSFHAKFYIVDQTALVGSANMTGTGMSSNRELSVVIDADDSRFEELPGIFDELWAAAAPITDEAINKFDTWKRNNGISDKPPIPGIDPVGPRTINVASHHISNERSYLQSFRALYEEGILPAHEKVRSLYFGTAKRHPFFGNYTESYELDRFLFWVAGEIRTQDLDDAPLRTDAELAPHLESRKKSWLEVEPDEVYHSESEVERYDQLTSLVATPEKIAAMGMDELTHLMSACNAFRERLRFTKGGLAPLLRKFEKGNTPESISKFLYTLIKGDGDYAQRTYDCIYNPELKLQEWGRNSTLEIFGWINNEGIPPVNGRTTKALRVLGLEIPLL